MAIAVAMLLVLAAYFSERCGGIDEIGLYNPTYMAVQYGKMTYPAYGHFTSMVVHPPLHYQAIAMFIRLGMGLYYAEATPAFLALLLCIWLVVEGPFTGAVKIGVLYGLWMSIAIFGRTGAELFGMRPENHLDAAWLGGLLALESGRLRNWDWKRLFLGAFLLAYASGVHYYAVLGVLGVAVYAAWAVQSLGLRRAARALLAIALGGLLFGVPYLLLFYFPEQAGIWKMIHDTQTGGGIASNLHAHRAQYASFLQQGAGGFWLKIPLMTGLPMVLFATPILLAIPSTRGIAMAALPLQLFLLFFAAHKHAYYYTHEIAIFGTAVAAGLITLAGHLLAGIPRRSVRYAVWTGVAALLVLGWWQLHKWLLGGPYLSLTPRVHEAEIARAAARRMLPPNPRVASRIGAWYSAGGDAWHDPSPDVLWPESVSQLNAVNYFSRFDAAAEYSHMSDAVPNRDHKALLSWYLDGSLHLGGFFFAGVNSDLTWLLLRVPPASPVTGYALKDEQLYRFTENGRGTSELDIVTSAESADLSSFLQNVRFGQRIALPKPNARTPQPYLVMALGPAQQRPEGQPIFPGARLVQRVTGDLERADKTLLVRQLRQEDRPMRFYRSIEEMPRPTENMPPIWNTSSR